MDGDLINHIKERVSGDETGMRNRREKVPERLQKKDDTVRLSGCGDHVVRGRTFWLEGKNGM